MSSRGQAGPGASAPPDVRARIAGPWVVRPGVPVVAMSQGAETPQPVPVDARHGDVALCRCGRTGTAPTCDRSHRSLVSPLRPAASFPCLPPDARVWSAASRCPGHGVLVVGDHVVVSPGLRVRLADGAVVVPDAPAVLCRCGRHLVVEPGDAPSTR